ncbi:MAG: lysylphosphatidylglycerol synthase domain-containing protein, partial [Acetobacteraceae bacterium]
MKRIPIILALGGVGLAAGLVVWLGAGKITSVVLSIGWWGFAIIVGWQLVLYVVLATAWRLVCPRASLWSVIWGRLVREGGTNMLPFSEFGGLAFGARALTLAGVRWSLATASSIADVSAEFLGELPFLLFGLAILVTEGQGSSFVLPLSIGFALLALAAAALIWA